MSLKAKEHGENQDGIYKGVMTQEEQCGARRRLCRAMGKVQTCLTHVEVNTISSKEEITDKKYVEYACHDENRKKFSQTSNTTLMHGKLFQEIVFYITSDICQRYCREIIMPPQTYKTTPLPT